MALVIIRAPKLANEQKKRIGDRIFEALHAEGIPASSTILLFKREEADILLDGGLLIEADCSGAAETFTPSAFAQPSRSFEGGLPAYVHRDPGVAAQRAKADFSTLRERLVALLQKHGNLSSFQAQEALDLKDCDGAPAALRRLFSELEGKGLIIKQGQKRGTRYVWSGQIGQSTPAPVILVKRDQEPFSAGEDTE